MESLTAQEDTPVSSSSSAGLLPVQSGFVGASQISSSRPGLPSPENRRQLNETGALLEIERLRFIDQGVNGGIEWKDVEELFDRLAKAGSGPLPVMNASDFNLCIGMQKTPEFAKELLGALRGRKNEGADITKNELHCYWHRINSPSFNCRLQIFFDLCNKNMDGRITRTEIKQVILLSASANKLFVTREEVEQYANLIIEALGTENQGYIELPQLETLLKVSSSTNYLSTDQVVTSPISDDDDLYQETKSTAEILLRAHWRRAWIVMCWLIVCFALFAWKFNQYSHRTGFEVMGYCLCTAKGAAETLKFNMALILVPVCRNSVTWLRKHRPINSIIPFNDNINFHKLIAGGIVVGVILHGGTHLACDFPRISGCDSLIFRQTIAARFGYHQPSYVQILATTEVATGIVMVILMAVAFFLATKWQRRRSPSLPRSVRRVTGFNTFWYSHHLFILVYGLLIIHSMFLFLANNATEKTTWMYITIPVLLYGCERMFRAIRSDFSNMKILKATIYPGKVLSVKMCKPEGFKYKSGMYIYIQCPQISSFEWHPFSLTSGPEDDYLSVHIRALGDWSYQIFSLFQEAIVSAGTMQYPKMYIDGPYGAASQDHVKYDILVLIGLGIGITPFISVLKDVINSLQKPNHDQMNCRASSITNCPSKAYLYWVTREASSFEWFRDIMKEISKTNQKQDVIEMNNFLTCAYQAGDVRSAVISAIQSLHHAKYGTDIVSHTPVHTHFARPNWFRIFSNLAHRHGDKCIGVFYCGPSMLARDLESLCTKFSTKTTTRFVFHKENY